ncbi:MULTISPECIES: amidohydrolase family protein [unclassified Bradyrhizobium]|uniref:amidohydrolase family protein n=1 Tax=unclassified Bradyrhizobium TaxID=2631580 RepID=UPI00247B2130|nr:MULTISPECIES: amidohydrolase family protein [unclassified Bradyrhizobium]WGS17814.1 amidohydrolase family protein [Bradyrhizobium sp. ISRA463]WGS24613.1 amidohydrolase family protein [Bradyrhizobium sp. ISRA464]
MVEAIDTHTHFVPRHIPAESARNPLWPSVELRDASAAVMVGGKVFRVIDSRSWDARRRLDDMAIDDIQVQVVSPMPELLSHWFPPADADALCRRVNEGIAALRADHPRHFVGIGMVPMQDVALAARRMEEIRSLGLRGIEIGTHINGIPLGDARLNDVYAAAEHAGLMVMIHPLHPLGLDRMGGRPELAAVAAFPLETAFAAVSLMTNGVLERFPTLRILLSHGGGALSWLLPRLGHAYGMGPPLQSLFAGAPTEMARSFYYDTVLYDGPALQYLADKVGTDQLVVGSDYPFTIKQDRPAQFAERVLSVSRAVLSANARRLFALR